MGLRILFSEGSSLTAREFLSVLGPRGHWIEIVDPNPDCICRFSRWAKRVHRCPSPGTDPLGYLAAVNEVLFHGGFDVLLPTHEQARLFAAAGAALSAEAGLAVSSAEAFSRVQDKIGCAHSLNEVGLPQPEWGIVGLPEELEGWLPPFFLKAPYSTAGMGVRKVTRMHGGTATFHYLRRAFQTGPFMVQRMAQGRYAQVQALFDHGRLVAAHTSEQTAVGVGGSAAGRVSVDHAFARLDVARLGKHLAWHGGLTLDYFYQGRDRVYIECNPRTVEPANAAASGVDLPGLQLELSLGRHPEVSAPGRSGVRTHGALAMLLGTAASGGNRRRLLGQAFGLTLLRGPASHSRECLTPILEDWLSAIPLAIAAGRLLLAPGSFRQWSEAAVRSCAVTPEAIERVANALSESGGRAAH